MQVLITDGNVLNIQLKYISSFTFPILNLCGDHYIVQYLLLVLANI